MNELIKLLTDAGIGIAILVIGWQFLRILRKIIYDERQAMQSWVENIMEIQKTNNDMREKILLTVTASIEKAVEDMKEVMLRVAMANRDQSTSNQSVLLSRLEVFEEALREAYPDLNTWKLTDKRRARSYGDNDFID